MKFLKIEAAALLSLIICIALSTYKLDRECEPIRQGILRLHVVAASDSREDQQIKLQLRDLLLTRGEELFSQSTSKADAQKKLKGGLSLLEECADTFLKGISSPHRAKISLKKSWFPTRQYEDLTLPAGFYDALQVIIGPGEGQNWWCVMFPALCLPAAEKGDLDGILTQRQQEIIREDKYEVRLWLVEKWQEIKKQLNL